MDDYSANPKYLQVADSIKQAVLDGHLKLNDTLPSINELSFDLAVSRDTIEKSYRKLKIDGILGSVPGKGFFIKSTDIEKQLKIFLLFNKLSEHKKIIYEAFAATLGEKAAIDFYIYNNDFSIFKKLLARHVGTYSHYVIIPHFIEGHEHAYELIDTLPKDKLLLLDKLIPQIKGEYAAVYENFESMNIYDAMEEALPLLSKYNSIKLIFPEHTYYAEEIISGLKRFCHQYALSFSLIHEIEKSTIEKGSVYINVMERDLVMLIEKIESTAMNIEQIKEYLPHRYPFLLIDRVLECQPADPHRRHQERVDQRGVFHRAFSHYHVMPGVLVVEGMAQAAAILSFKTLDVRPDKKSVYYFAGIDSARLKRRVVPGDQIRYEITAGRSIRGIAKFSGVARWTVWSSRRQNSCAPISR